jgi:hypothetical protein
MNKILLSYFLNHIEISVVYFPQKAATFDNSLSAWKG